MEHKYFLCIRLPTVKCERKELKSLLAINDGRYLSTAQKKKFEQSFTKYPILIKSKILLIIKHGIILCSRK